MTRESLYTASHLWADMMIRQKLVAVTLNQYPKPRFGVQTTNQMLEDHQMTLLEQDFRDSRMPQITPDHISGARFPRSMPPVMIAVASPVYTWTGARGRSTHHERMAWTKHIAYEQEAGFSQMIRWGLIRPKAIPAIDFEWPKTANNFQLILDTLTQHFRTMRWHLLGTKKSFHAIYEELMEPDSLPIFWSQTLLAFAPIAPLHRQHIIEAFAHDMKKASRNPELSSSWYTDVRGAFCHYTRPELGKFPFAVDMFHMGREADNLARYRRGERIGVGNLLITAKGTEGPPYVLASHSPRRGLRLYKAISKLPTDIQPRLL